MQERRRAEETVRIEFSTAPDYRIVVANGVWGGLTPRGELKVDFILDSIKTPDSVVHSITPEGGLGPEIERQRSSPVSRELQVGVLLSIGHAESIANWILDKVREARGRAAGEAGEQQ